MNWAMCGGHKLTACCMLIKLNALKNINICHLLDTELKKKMFWTTKSARGKSWVVTDGTELTEGFITRPPLPPPTTPRCLPSISWNLLRSLPWLFAFLTWCLFVSLNRFISSLQQLTPHSPRSVPMSSSFSLPFLKWAPARHLHLRVLAGV